MRGKLESVNKKMHMIRLAAKTFAKSKLKDISQLSPPRSRSAERLRGGLRPGAPVIQVAPTGLRSRYRVENLSVNISMRIFSNAGFSSLSLKGTRLQNPRRCVQ